MTTKTHRSQYGREPITVATTTPTFAISHIVGRVHVSTSDDDIRDLILARIERLPDAARATWTNDAVDDAIAYAIWRHRENRAEYHAVMSGHLS